jgi:hypothetical protein
MAVYIGCDRDDDDASITTSCKICKLQGTDVQCLGCF